MLPSTSLNRKQAGSRAKRICLQKKKSCKWKPQSLTKSRQRAPNERNPLQVEFQLIRFSFVKLFTIDVSIFLLPNSISVFANVPSTFDISFVYLWHFSCKCTWIIWQSSFQRIPYESRLPANWKWIHWRAPWIQNPRQTR